MCLQSVEITIQFQHFFPQKITCHSVREISFCIITCLSSQRRCDEIGLQVINIAERAWRSTYLEDSYHQVSYNYVSLDFIATSFWSQRCSSSCHSMFLDLTNRKRSSSLHCIRRHRNRYTLSEFADPGFVRYPSLYFP